MKLCSNTVPPQSPPARLVATVRQWAVALCVLAVLAAAVPCAAEMAEEAAVAPAVPQTADKNSVEALPAVNTAPEAQNSPTEVQELWTGSLYTSTYRVGVCFSAQGAVRGVVHLRLRNGTVDVYHIEGGISNNEITARHSSGHSFKGRLVSSDRVEGVISLKNGMQVRLEGRRTHSATLAAEDCAPPIL